MKLIEAYQKLMSFAQPLLQTTDVAALLRLPRGHASKIMTRLSQNGFVVPLARGRWAISRDVDQLTIPECLTAPAPSYISLQSALSYHGMISQISNTIYAVSLSRTRLYKTDLGVFSIHHLDPRFFFGFQSVGPARVKMATPEKALVDFLYLSSARSQLFHVLPELELPKNFNVKKVLEIIAHIESKSRRMMVQNQWAKILKR